MLKEQLRTKGIEATYLLDAWLAMNTRIRLLIRLAYGFHSHRPLIGLAMLKLGGLCPSLPMAA